MRTEDGRIIHRCINGEPEAFGLLVDKYKAGIYAFVYAKLRDFHDAQDVTQEVFIKAYRDLRSLRQWESFVFWLYRIASSHCGKWLRAKARRPDQEFIEDQAPGTLEGRSMDSYRQNQVDESLHEALYSLPEAYREVLTLYYFAGMNSEDIARALGMSPTAIRKRLSRARAQLREEMAVMMGTALERQKLQASFTFRIVEAVKRIKIDSTPRATALPWGLSLAAGIIISVMSLGSQISLQNPTSMLAGSPLPAEMRVLEIGEIPVDVLRIPNISLISGQKGNGKSGEFEFPGLQKALFMAPQAGRDMWTKKADMPTARVGLSTSVVNGKVYAVGGATLGGTVIPTVEEYDPATDKWAKKVDMPTARFFLATSAVGGKVYAIGGRIAQGGVATSTVEEYDPAMDKWTRKADMPTARFFLATSAVGGKIYAIGGQRGNLDLDSCLSTVEEYDPATDKWAGKADMPTARGALSTSAVNGKIYAIGGHIPFTPIPTVEEYDPVLDKWTKKSDMPTGRAVLSTSAVGGNIYAIGGRGIITVFLSKVEEYDPATDKWIKKADMPTARTTFSASAVGRKIYAIGGESENQGILAVVEEYDTGSVDEGKNTEVTGKLPTAWGAEKRREDMETR